MLLRSRGQAGGDEHAVRAARLVLRGVARRGVDWDRIAFKASENPRLDPEFLAEERGGSGERWFGQEYESEFNDTTGQVFSSESIEAALDNDLVPLFPE